MNQNVNFLRIASIFENREFDEILTMFRVNSKSSTELKILKIRQFDISRNTQRTTHVIDLIQRVDCNLHMTKQLSMSQIRVFDVVVTCTVFKIFERLSLREFSRGAHFRDSAQIYEIDDTPSSDPEMSAARCLESALYFRCHRVPQFVNKTMITHL